MRITKSVQRNIRTPRRVQIGAALLMVFGGSHQLWAQSPSPQLQAQEAILHVIRESANSICINPPTTYHESSLQLTGEADAKLAGAVGKLVDLGARAAAKYRTKESRGLLAKDVATAIRDGDDCRLAVFNTLVAKMFPPPTPPRQANSPPERVHHQTPNPLQIRWTPPVGATPGIRYGRATVAGHTIKIEGFTLRCEIWDVKLTGDAADTLLSGNGPQSRDINNGRDIASQYWERETETDTFHRINIESTDPGNAYHVPPWEGRYQWKSNASGWIPYPERPSDDTIVIITGDTWNIGGVMFLLPPTQGTGVAADHTFTGINDSMSLYFKERFEINLTAFTAHQTIDPYFGPFGSAISIAPPNPTQYCDAESAREDYLRPIATQCAQFLQGFRSVTASKDAKCALVAYRQPPDPEPSSPPGAIRIESDH